MPVASTTTIPDKTCQPYKLSTVYIPHLLACSKHDTPRYMPYGTAAYGTLAYMLLLVRWHTCSCSYVGIHALPYAAHMLNLLVSNARSRASIGKGIWSSEVGRWWRLAWNSREIYWREIPGIPERRPVDGSNACSSNHCQPNTRLSSLSPPSSISSPLSAAEQSAPCRNTKDEY